MKQMACVEAWTNSSTASNY